MRVEQFYWDSGFIIGESEQVVNLLVHSQTR